MRSKLGQILNVRWLQIPGVSGGLDLLCQGWVCYGWSGLYWQLHTVVLLVVTISPWGEWWYTTPTSRLGQILGYLLESLMPWTRCATVGVVWIGSGMQLSSSVLLLAHGGSGGTLL